MEEGFPWHRFIKSRYGLKENSWGASCGLHQEYYTPWKSICKDSELFFYNLRYIVGDGDKIHFWDDLWLEGGSLSNKIS